MRCTTMLSWDSCGYAAASARYYRNRSNNYSACAPEMCVRACSCWMLCVLCRLYDRKYITHWQTHTHKHTHTFTFLDEYLTIFDLIRRKSSVHPLRYEAEQRGSNEKCTKLTDNNQLYWYAWVLIEKTNCVSRPLIVCTYICVVGLHSLMQLLRTSKLFSNNYQQFY